jgi:hypothetical protein
MAIPGFIQLRNYGGVRYPLPITCTQQPVLVPAFDVVYVLVTEDNWVSARGAYVAPVILTPSIWTNFSKNCSFVQEGTGCPIAGDGAGKPAQPLSQQGGNPPGDEVLLFSWGAQEPLSVTPGTGLNSWLEVQFGSNIDFSFGTVAFETINPAPNLGPEEGPAPGTYNPTQGAGTMVCYEKNNQILNPGNADVHHVTDQRMDIHYWDAETSAITRTVEGWFVAADQGTAESSATQYRIPPVSDPPTPPGIAQFTLDAARQFFFTNSGVATVNDPESVVANQDTSVRVNQGKSLLFQFYEADWNNNVLLEAAAPDAYYGSFNVVIKPQQETV